MNSSIPISGKVSEQPLERRRLAQEPAANLAQLVYLLLGQLQSAEKRLLVSDGRRELFQHRGKPIGALSLALLCSGCAAGMYWVRLFWST